MRPFTQMTLQATAIAAVLGFSSLNAMAAGADPQAPADAASAAPAVKGLFISPPPDAGQTPPGVSSKSVQPPPGPPPGRMGPLSDLGDALEKKGIELGLYVANGHFENPSVGVQRGRSVDYFEVGFSADVDLYKLVGVPNTKFHFKENWQPPSNNTGSFSSQVATGLAPFPPTQTDSNLVRLTLSHEFFDKKLHVEYGRLNLTEEFMVANMCTGCFGATPIVVLGLPPRDKSLWGAWTSYALTPESRVGFAVVEDNYDLQTTSTGWNWNNSTRKGWIGLGHWTYSSDFFKSDRPVNAEVGLYHGTKPYVDGNSFPVPISTPFGVIPVTTHRSGTTGFYGQGRKVVWKAADAAPGPFPPNVAVYGGTYYTPGDGQPFPFEAYTGVEYGGFLKDNPIAAVGSTWRYLQLGKGRDQFEQEKGVGTKTVHRDTYSADVHAQYGIGPGMLVNAAAQYFLNPNRMGPALTVGETRSGWLFGLFFVVDVGRLTGLR